MIGQWRARSEQAQGRIKGGKPVAVLDIGSNSVRLVVYERHVRALTPLYNEKSSCALGRGVATTGRLADENTARALKAMRRFALVAELMKVGQVHVLATSAVRDAENGALFSAAVEDIMHAPVRVLDGAEEAHYAALGVVSGIPDFSGVVGDLGGGSLELSQVESGEDFEGETHQLGVIRLQDDSDTKPSKAAKIASERLKESGLLKASKGRVFCAIGGTWRSLAKLHQRRCNYPLSMVQHYATDADGLMALCDEIIQSFEATGSFDNSEVLSSSRRALMPYGAAVMAETLRTGGFDQVVFSALGVREGYLYGQLDAKERVADPLLMACEEMSVLRSRSPTHATDLIGFSDKLLAQCDFLETATEKRLRSAVCYLSDMGWRGHPDYRGEQSVDLIAYGALIGIDHPGRAFLAETLAVRYMGLKRKSASAKILKLAGSAGSQRARLLGALMRVAFPMSAGMAGILNRVDFARDDDVLLLQLPEDLAFLEGERLQNRLSQLADQAGFAKSAIMMV